MKISSVLRRRPRPHRCSCFHRDLLRLHPNKVAANRGQRSAHPQLRSRRPQRLWYGSRPVDSAKVGDRYPLVSIFVAYHVINCCVPCLEYARLSLPYSTDNHESIFYSACSRSFNILNLSFAAMLVYFLVRAKAVRQFCVSFRAVVRETAMFLSPVSLCFISVGMGLSAILAYQIYFYVYWTSFTLEANPVPAGHLQHLQNWRCAPLKGLQTLGMLVFRWVAAISVAVAIGVAVTPHLSGIKFMLAMITQLQQAISSILTLCLLCLSALPSCLWSVVQEPHLRREPWPGCSGNGHPGECGPWLTH